jgi:hypothetical protein
VPISDDFATYYLQQLCNWTIPHPSNQTRHTGDASMGSEVETPVVIEELIDFPMQRLRGKLTRMPARSKYSAPTTDTPQMKPHLRTEKEGISPATCSNLFSSSQLPKGMMNTNKSGVLPAMKTIQDDDECRRPIYFVTLKRLGIRVI